MSNQDMPLNHLSSLFSPGFEYSVMLVVIQISTLRYHGASWNEVMIRIGHVTTTTNVPDHQIFLVAYLPFSKNNHHQGTGGRRMKMTCFIYHSPGSNSYYLGRRGVFIAGFVNFSPCSCFRQLIINWHKWGRWVFSFIKFLWGQQKCC